MGVEEKAFVGRGTYPRMISQIRTPHVTQFGTPVLSLRYPASGKNAPRGSRVFLSNIVWLCLFPG
eukprot:370928-Rhodomonas_salina.3